MFFTVSKVFFIFAQPSSLTVFLIAAGLAATAIGLRRTGRWLAYGVPPDFRAANRSTTSRLPMPRKAAIAARFLPRGCALPCSQA